MGAITILNNAIWTRDSESQRCFSSPSGVQYDHYGLCLGSSAHITAAASRLISFLKNYSCETRHCTDWPVFLMSSQTLLWLKPVAWGDSLIPRGEPIQTLGKVILHFTSPSLPKWLPRFTEHALPSLRTVAPLALQAQLNNNNAVSSRPQIIARDEIATNFYWYTNNRSKGPPPPPKKKNLASAKYILWGLQCSSCWNQ